MVQSRAGKEMQAKEESCDKTHSLGVEFTGLSQPSQLQTPLSYLPFRTWLVLGLTQDTYSQCAIWLQWINITSRLHVKHDDTVTQQEQETANRHHQGGRGQSNDCVVSMGQNATKSDGR